MEQNTMMMMMIKIKTYTNNNTSTTKHYLKKVVIATRWTCLEEDCDDHDHPSYRSFLLLMAPSLHTKIPQRGARPQWWPRPRCTWMTNNNTSILEEVDKGKHVHQTRKPWHWWTRTWLKSLMILCCSLLRYQNLMKESKT